MAQALMTIRSRSSPMTICGWLGQGNDGRNLGFEMCGVLVHGGDLSVNRE